MYLLYCSHIEGFPYSLCKLINNSYCQILDHNDNDNIQEDSDKTIIHFLYSDPKAHSKNNTKEA